MKTIWRYSGHLPPESLLETLTEHMERFQPALIAEGAERTQREMDRILRQQQDEEYERSLQRDREKEDAAEAEKAKIEREEQEAKNKEEMRAKELERKKRNLPNEPAAGEPRVQLKFKFPNGVAYDRSFSPDTSVQQVYDFVDTREGSEISADFSVYTQYPRQLLECGKGTLADHGIKGRGVLNVQDNSV